MDSEDVVTFEEAVKEGERRIMFTGPRRSGKSSIERVIFHKMSPHETLFLESTHNVDVHVIANNDFVKFQTWDFGGDMNLEHGVNYMGKHITPEMILKGCSTLVYVIDAQEEDYEDSLPKLVETIIAAHKVNPKIHFEVFLHKVDGDMMPEELRAERQQGIQNYVSAELSESSGDVLVSYYLTSIYDHSALEAFSKVISGWYQHCIATSNHCEIYGVFCSSSHLRPPVKSFSYRLCRSWWCSCRY
jgi:Ras-related GTP-binding protein C/D